jgi:hypothetical protein
MIDMSEKIDVESLNFPEDTTDTEVTPQEGNEQPVVEQKTEEPAKEPVIEKTETKVETKEVTNPTEKEVKISNPPQKYEGETDIQFNLRQQIYNAGQAKAQADTDEEKSILSKHISSLRKELAQSSKSTKVETTQSQPEPAKVEDDDKEQIKQSLREMGFLPADEVEARAMQMIAQQSRQQEHISATKEFYSVRKDIASDPIKKEILEKIVVERFNITPNTTGEELKTAMDMAAMYLFPKQSISAGAREAADKRDLYNTGSPVRSDEKSNQKVDDKTRSALKSQGWSDEDIESFT